MPYREAEGHVMELPLHRHGSHAAKSQVLTGVLLVLCLVLLELGGQELQLHVILQPGEALPHPGHVSGLLFLCSRLGCHRPTRIPLQSESQSHFPTSSSTAKFLHFPSCLSQRPSCPLTLPPLAFFLLLDRPHPTHTQRSTHPRLPLDSFPPKQSQGKRGLSGWWNIPASLAALLA